MTLTWTKSRQVLDCAAIDCNQCADPTVLSSCATQCTACSSCVDTVGLCDYYYSQGYCQDLIYSAYTLGVCPRVCGVCNINPSPPPLRPPPASTVCKNVNTTKNCVYWQGQGYCSSGSDYYYGMQYQCPATCKFCSHR